MTCLRCRCWWLVGVLAVLPAAAALTTRFPVDQRTSIPFLLIARSIPLGGIALLSFWAGLGNRNLAWRLAALFVGTIYFSLFWPLTIYWYTNANQDFDFFNFTRAQLIGAAMKAALFAAMRWRYELRVLPADSAVQLKNRIQFSVKHLLMLMAFIAIVLVLTRLVRTTALSSVEGEIVSGWWSMYGLSLVTSLSGVAIAPFAALGRTSVTRNCLLVAMFSALLGATYEFSVWHVWMTSLSSRIPSALANVIPPVMLMVSLLWLRPCGLRLVRRVPVADPLSRSEESAA